MSDLVARIVRSASVGATVGLVTTVAQLLLPIG
jgi:hypothetical protein